MFQFSSGRTLEMVVNGITSACIACRLSKLLSDCRVLISLGCVRICRWIGLHVIIQKHSLTHEIFIVYAMTLISQKHWPHTCSARLRFTFTNTSFWLSAIVVAILADVRKVIYMRSSYRGNSIIFAFLDEITHNEENCKKRKISKHVCEYQFWWWKAFQKWFLPVSANCGKKFDTEIMW